MRSRWIAPPCLLLLLAAPPAEAQEWGAAAGELLTLEEAIEIALERNRDVLEARRALAGAEGQVREAWGSVYPAIDLSARYIRNISAPISFLPEILFDPAGDPDRVVPVRFGADNVWNTTLTLEQPLFEAQAFIGVGAAGRYRALQEEIVRGRTHVVVTQVRTAYYNLLLAQEETRLIENSIERVREALDETRALQRAGLASEYEVLRLEVEVANLVPNLRRARNAMSGGRRQLALTLALPEGEELRIAGSLAEMELGDAAANSEENRMILAFAGMNPSPSASREETDEIVRQAQRDRSDVRQLEQWRSLRQTELRLEQAEYLPRVALFGNYTINAQQSGSPVFFGENSDQRAYMPQVGISVSIPVFSGFARGARVGQRREAVRQADLQVEQGTQQAEVQVKGLLEDIVEARERAEGQRLAVRQATRGFEIASAQYREGISSQLELTDAEGALRQSEFNYARAVYDYLVARALLDEATGRAPGA